MGDLVSIVVVAYNAEECIGEALVSALRQTEPDFEIVAVDDGSSDRTPEIIEYFAARDGRVRSLRLPANGGPGRARNVALEMARGRWVTMLDADDRYLPRRLETLLAYAHRLDADFVADNIMLATPAGRPLGVMFPGITSPMVVSPAEFVANNKPGDTKRKYGLFKPLMRRSFIVDRDLRYDDGARIGEDFLFYLGALLQGCRFVAVPDVLYAYSLTPTAITRSRSPADMHYAAERFRSLADSRRVRDDPSLQRAVGDRLRLVERDLEFHTLAEPLRQKRFGEAFRRIAAKPHLLPYIGARLLKSARFRLGQRLRPGPRTFEAAAGVHAVHRRAADRGRTREHLGGPSAPREPS